MKPVVWIHKASGRIRFDGKDLPDSWIPLYAKESLEIEPLKIYENPDLTEKTQRVLSYIKTLQKPVRSSAIAQQFAISKSAAARHLAALQRANLVEKKRVGSQVIWPLVKHAIVQAEPVIETPEKPQNIVWPTSTFSTSYPHARGYDD
jgi:DNA-binding transcriptional ArsR family regulator